MKGFFRLFFEAFHDTILLVLILASVVSLIIGITEQYVQNEPGQVGSLKGQPGAPQSLHLLL